MSTSQLGPVSAGAVPTLTLDVGLGAIGRVKHSLTAAVGIIHRDCSCNP